MPIYHQLGRVPRKRHVAFRKEGGGIHYEELVGNKGFTGPSSLLYHLRLPTAVKGVREVRALAWVTEPERLVRHRHFRTSGLATGPSPVLDRVPLLFNADVALSIARPTKEDTFFYRNGQGDEVVYVVEGEGILDSSFGEVAWRAGDYVVVPRGVLHRFRLGKGPFRLLVIESAGYVRTPKHYRNEHGQLTEMAPYSERDIRRPTNLETHDETGDFEVVVKSGNRLVEMTLAHHPFDVVGWDGYYYPWAFSIHDFEPRVGRIHLPPPVHQTFEGDGFVVCSFCPRPFDFEPDAVPAPYSHQNVMSDEVLFYANAQFMSRKGIELGSITLHPDGLPHGPQPGKTEESIGAKTTNELAVMLDTFRPLLVGKDALAIEDTGYALSWLEPLPRELSTGRDKSRELPTGRDKPRELRSRRDKPRELPTGRDKSRELSTRRDKPRERRSGRGKPRELSTRRDKSRELPTRRGKPRELRSRRDKPRELRSGRGKPRELPTRRGKPRELRSRRDKQ